MVRYGKTIAIAIAALVVFIVAVPNLLSTTYVKQQISIQISQLIGRQVSIDGSSSISLRPYLGVSYNDVTISDEHDEKGKPLVVMEGIKARLSLFSAMIGNAKVTELELVRPHFHLRVDPMGHENWGMDNGLLGAQLNSPGMLGDVSLGSINIIDGILEINDERKRRTRQLTAINGQINWPSTSSAAQANLSAVWNGEVTDLGMSVREPIPFLRGEETAVSVKLRSTGAELSFDGQAQNLFSQASGNLNLSSPSPKRLSDWLGLDISLLSNLGETTLSGPIAFDDGKLDVSEANLEVDGHKGRGRLLLELQETSLLSIGGTLAFESLELPALAGLLGVKEGAEVNDGAYSPDLFQGLTVDLRLSAGAAKSDPIEMSGLAASVIIRDGQMSFDVGQAEMLGGVAAGFLSLKGEDAGLTFGAEVSFSDISLAELTNPSQQSGVFLEGTGAVVMKLKSRGTNVSQLLLRLNGEGTLKAKDGLLYGIDMEETFAQIKNEAQNAIRLTGDTTSFKGLNLGFFIANGTAFLQNSQLESESLQMVLGGRADLVEQSLALRGSVSDGEADESDTRTFFVGGTLSAPLIIPVPQRHNGRE